MAKKKRIGRVQSKRTKTERASHTISLIYYIIMLIFAISLYITLAIVWTKIIPLLDSLDDVTNSTTSNISIFINLIITLIIV